MHSRRGSGVVVEVEWSWKWSGRYRYPARPRKVYPAEVARYPARTRKVYPAAVTPVVVADDVWCCGMGWRRCDRYGYGFCVFGCPACVG